MHQEQLKLTYFTPKTINSDNEDHINFQLTEFTEHKPQRVQHMDSFDHHVNLQQQHLQPQPLMNSKSFINWTFNNGQAVNSNDHHQTSHTSGGIISGPINHTFGDINQKMGNKIHSFQT